MAAIKKPDLADIVGIIGALVLSGGVWMVHHAAGVIVLGALMMGGAILAARSG